MLAAWLCFWPWAFAQEPETPYQPPNWEAFFPDDPAGGKALDQLFAARHSDRRSADQRLAIVRNGLRRTSAPRNRILEWVGNKFVWEKQPEHPLALEIMYHAADGRPEVQHYRTRYAAVYFGLSVTKQKTPRMLHALADLCMTVDDPETIGRIAWGYADQQQALVAWLAPYLASADPAVRSKAYAMQRVLCGEWNAYDWSKRWLAQQAAQFSPEELSSLQAILETGDSTARLTQLEDLQTSSRWCAMPESCLPQLALAARDSDARVRMAVARGVADRWAEPGAPAPATDLLLELSQDANPEVRRTAVFEGLSQWPTPSDAVLERLLEVVRSEQDPTLTSRIGLALTRNRVQAMAVLERWIGSTDSARAVWAHGYYPRVAGGPASIEPKPEAPPALAYDWLGDWTLEFTDPAGTTRTERLNLALEGTQEPTPHFALVVRLGDQTARDLALGVLEGESVLAFEVEALGNTLHANLGFSGDRGLGSARVAGKGELWVLRAARDH